MKKSQVVKNSLKFWKRLREIQASQPSEENFCPELNLLQDLYYKKYIRESELNEKKEEYLVLNKNINE